MNTNERKATDTELSNLTCDDVNARLRDGRLVRADAFAWRDLFNGSGKHFGTAMCFGHVVYISMGEPVEGTDQ